MSRFTDNITRLKVEEILHKCLLISCDTKADAFCDFAPHVNSLHVKIFLNGWKEFSDLNYPEDYEFFEDFYLYLDGNIHEDFSSKLDFCLQRLDFYLNIL